MGVYQNVTLDLLIPSESIAPLTAAIREKFVTDWANYGWSEDQDNDHELVTTLILTVEGGTSDIEVISSSDGLRLLGSIDNKVSMVANDVEMLYAAHGVTGTIEGESSGELFLTIFADGTTRGFGGQVIYPGAMNPMGMAYQALHDFVSGDADEATLVAAATAARSEATLVAAAMSSRA